MHRLWSLCPGLSGVRNFRARRPAREMEAVYGTERELRECRQIHARRVRQAPEQIIFWVFGQLNGACRTRFTSAFEELDPIPQYMAPAKLGDFLKARFSQSF